MIGNAIIIALIPGCVEVAKRSGLPSRFAPLAAVVIGITLAFLAARSGETAAPINAALAAEIVLTGLTNALAAIGLYKLVPKPAAQDDQVS